MKKHQLHLLWLVIAGLLLPLSCSDDLLNQTNTNTVSSDIFWQNESDARFAVDGMYHPFTGTFFWGRIVHVGAFLRSDEFNIRGLGTNTSMSTFQGEPGVARWAIEPWQELYKVIFRANNIIENVNETNVADANARAEVLGQAYFMRGLSYFYLVNLYGNVPLVVKVSETDEEFFPMQAAPSAVWAQAIADFREAEGQLPARSDWSDSDAGRPSSGAAAAMLGKSLLYTGDWSGAEMAFRRVEDSGEYDLLPADRWTENFTEVNENNEESVFELQFHPVASFVWGQDVPNTGTQGNFLIEYAPPSKTPDNGHVVNSWVRDIFEANNDMTRRNGTLAYDYPGSTVFAGIPFTADTETEGGLSTDIGFATEDGVDAIFSRKYSGMEKSRAGTNQLGENYGANWRVVRYADVLLMLAESLAKQDKYGEAISYINQVRVRAEVAELDPMQFMNEETTMDAVEQERVLELTGESHRFFDLVRWNKAEEYLGANSSHPGPHPKSITNGVFEKDKHELIWIPVGEMDANPNLKQNPGYL